MADKYINLYQKNLNKQNNLSPNRHKNLNILAAVVMAIILTACIVRPITSAYANITKKLDATDNLIAEAIERDRVRQEKAHQEYIAKYNAELEAKKMVEKVEALNKNFTRGDWIIITWWRNPSPSPTAPEGTSCTGQIKKIVGDKVYGTWGDNALTYEEEVWHRCSKGEYLEARQKEQKKRDKAKIKKEFVSWGIHPSTAKSK